MQPSPDLRPPGTPDARWEGAGLVKRLRIRGSLSATELVEQGIVVVFAVLRLGLIVEMGIATFWLVQASASWLILVTTMLALLFSIAITISVILTGRIRPWPWGVADIGVATASVIVCGLLLPTDWLALNYFNWTMSYAARAVPFTTAWLRSIKVPLLIALGVGTAYGWTHWSSQSGQSMTILQNGIDLLIYTGAASAFVLYARKVAALADEGRVRAVELGTQTELTRYRHHVHNATGILAHLARSDTPDHLLPGLRAQAGEESNRLRREVLEDSQPIAPSTNGSVSLPSVIWDACASFSNLPLELRTGLARSVRLPAEQTAALRSALVALLYNVQFHARAEQVVVHADGETGNWEVSVADDGVGFDHGALLLGFGLGEQVIASLARFGISTSVDTQQGEGTCVTLRYNAAAASGTSRARVEPASTRESLRRAHQVTGGESEGTLDIGR